MPSKLSLHIMGPGGVKNLEEFLAAEPSYVKLVNDYGPVLGCGPKTLVIGREIWRPEKLPDTAQGFLEGGWTPVTAAADFVREQLRTYQLNPRIKFWEGHNEPVWTTPEQMIWYAQLEIARMFEMDALGLKCVIGNFACGTPLEHLLPYFKPALDYAAAHGHLYGFHNYSNGFMWYSSKYLSLRHRFVHELCPDVLIVSTETGLDPLANAEMPPDCPGGTWQSPALQAWWREIHYNPPSDDPLYKLPAGVEWYDDPALFYLEQLKWLDRQVRQEPNTLGLAVFTAGSPGGWYDFDVQHKLMLPLANYIISQRDVIDIPPEPPEPPVVGTPQKVLQVPYYSQQDNTVPNDCGPACMTMLEDYLTGKPSSIEKWYLASGAVGSAIAIWQLQQAADKLGYVLDYSDGNSKEDLRAAIDRGEAVCILVNASGLMNCGTGVAHFVDVVGYHNNAFFIHDPYLISTTPARGGSMIYQPDIRAAWYTCHLQGNPNGVMLLLRYKPATSSCILGVGTASSEAITSIEEEALRVSKVQAIKILTLQDEEQMRLQVERAQNNCALVMARLMFSVDAETQFKFSPELFWEYCRGPALNAYSRGVDWFEVHNEPNLRSEGYGWNWDSPEAFQSWYLDLLLLLRRDMPRAKFIFPGLSPQEGYSLGCASNDFYARCAQAIQVSGGLGVHCYWQDWGSGHWQMDSDDFGGRYYERIQRLYLGKRMFITEFSCNNRNISDAVKGKMYKLYPSKCLGVDVAYCFALSWPGQDLNNEGWVRNGQLTGIPEAIAS